MTYAPPDRQFVDGEGSLTNRAQIWTELVTQQQIITGSGSPEGVVSAAPTRLYMNTAGTAGNILYIKRDAAVSGDSTQGWILV